MQGIQTLGDRIRFARVIRRWTQKDLAKKLGVTQTAVKNWEMNLHRPHVLRLPMIADMLGTTVEELKGE
jgi:transcriptional regulator with XRE-family HTH domain